MSVHLIRWVKLSPNFDATKWSVTTEPEDKIVLASMPNIVARLGVFAEEYNALIADLNVLRAKVPLDCDTFMCHRCMQMVRLDRSATGEKLSGMALRALRTVAGWNATIMELVCWRAQWLRLTLASTPSSSHIRRISTRPVAARRTPTRTSGYANGAAA